MTLLFLAVVATPNAADQFDADYQLQPDKIHRRMEIASGLEAQLAGTERGNRPCVMMK